MRIFDVVAVMYKNDIYTLIINGTIGQRFSFNFL